MTTQSQPQQWELVVIMPMLITMMIVMMMLGLIRKMMEPEVLEKIVPIAEAVLLAKGAK